MLNLSLILIKWHMLIDRGYFSWIDWINGIDGYIYFLSLLSSNKKRLGLLLKISLLWMIKYFKDYIICNWINTYK